MSEVSTDHLKIGDQVPLNVFLEIAPRYVGNENRYSLRLRYDETAHEMSVRGIAFVEKGKEHFAYLVAEQAGLADKHRLKELGSMVGVDEHHPLYSTDPHEKEEYLDMLHEWKLDFIDAIRKRSIGLRLEIKQAPRETTLEDQLRRPHYILPDKNLPDMRAIKINAPFFGAY